MLVCLYEDRPYQVAGLKILLLSLGRYCPLWPVRLRFPGISGEFREWLTPMTQVTIIDERLPRSGSYDVKPAVLLDGLASGANACLWMDTDVVVNGSLDAIEAEPPETIIVTQDPWEYEDGSTYRCDSWGLKKGRSLPGPLNSAVVRITGRHEALLKAWHELISSDAYLAEQAKPVGLRDPNILGDQDGLSALLASSGFADIPVRRLRHASEILQHHGAGAYGLKQRWETWRHGLPALVHAMGLIKPWKMPQRPGLGRPRDYYERVYLELSPYVHLARQYRQQLGEAETGWLDIRTAAGGLGTIMALNQPQLKGIVQATAHRAFFKL